MPLHTVKISVRQLVEFILRSGDIDVAYMGANRAAEGTRAHQRVQRKKKAEAKANGFTYESEVFLQTDCAHRDILFHVEGRADGVQRANDGEITVEEIKSTLGAVPAYAPEESHWHWAQAKCYGYMYLSGVQTDGETPRDEETRANPPPPGLRVSLTYCQIETETTRTFSLYFTCGELKSFFLALLEKYHAFAQMDADRIEERNRTAKALPFPYGAYRAGQREMAVAAFAAIKQGRKLFAQAPTGTGKTVSVLFPAVKSLSEGYGCKIFYLTAKTVARQAAEEALRHMTDKGLRMRGITLTAKDKICFCEPRRCDPEYCQYAKGHFDRVNAALLDCLRGEPLLTRPVVENYARKHSVCPSEFQLDLALFCDTVICDYNHVYDP
ncbi:MAG: ATP-dependent DNA helicase, partial [Clostridiales bacterium]|nr:ATP-dependent DNA helicase [Clostridiales bacterium]